MATLLKSKKPSVLTGVGSTSGKIVGNIAAGLGSLPGSIASGVADGYRSGQEGYQTVQKQRAAYQLVTMENLQPARQAAQEISRQIRDAKNTKKNLAFSGLEPKEYAKEITNLNDSIQKTKDEFEKAFGTSYDAFASLVSNFANEADFISTCSTMAEEAAKQLAEERKELEEAYTKEDTELKQREEAFASIVSRVKPGGIRGWVAGVTNRKPDNA